MSTATNTTKAQKGAPALASVKAGLPPAREGYKHTKLGWIPEEWQITGLAELAGPEGAFIDGDWIESKDMSASGIALVQTGNIGIGQLLGISDKFVSQSTFMRLKCSELRSGDILICRMADPAGRACKLEIPSGIRLITSVDVTIMRTDATLVADDYLLQWLSSPWYLRDVSKACTGSAHTRISRSNLGKMLVALPPLPEQRRIAAVLGAWDRAIATVQQLLAAQQVRKRGLMQELLTGRRRFKGFGGKWKSHCLGDLFERVTRKNTVGEEHVLTISAQHGLIDQREIFNKSVAGANLAGYYLLKNGEFAYNKSSSNGYPVGAIKRLDRYEQGILSVLYICFALKPGAANSDFMAAYFDAGMLDKGIGAIAQEGARNHGLLNVSTTDFFDIDVHIPEEPEQEAIAKAIGALNKETEAIQNYLDHLTTQKRGLMQQLLTGAVRVKQ